MGQNQKGFEQDHVLLNILNHTFFDYLLNYKINEYNIQYKNFFTHRFMLLKQLLKWRKKFKIDTLIICTIFLIEPVKPAIAMGTASIVSVRPIVFKTQRPIYITPTFKRRITKIKFKNASSTINRKQALRFKNKEIYQLRGGSKFKDIWNKILFCAGLYALLYQIPVSDAFLLALQNNFYLPHSYTPRFVGNPYQSNFFRLNREYFQMGRNLEGGIFNYDQAYQMIVDYVPPTIEVRDGFNISGFQALKKINNAHGMDCDLLSFNADQKQLNRISRHGGIIDYVQRGEKLPDIELVRDYQERSKLFCENPLVCQRTISHYGKSAYAFFDNLGSRRVVLFDSQKNFISAEKYRENTYIQITEHGFFGKIPLVSEIVDPTTEISNLNYERPDLISENLIQPTEPTE
jgi:hypothetical protein